MAIFHPRAGDPAPRRLGNAVVPIGQRFIRDTMPEQHQRFFAQLPFVLLGRSMYKAIHAQACSPARRASARARRGGISTCMTTSWPAKAFQALAPGRRSACSASKPIPDGETASTGRSSARRRHAEPGRSAELRQLSRHIQPRHAEWQPAAASGAHVTRGWDAAAGRMVAGADTFFIVTAHPDAARRLPRRATVNLAPRRRGRIVRIDGQTLSGPTTRATASSTPSAISTQPARRALCSSIMFPANSCSWRYGRMWNGCRHLTPPHLPRKDAAFRGAGGKSAPPGAFRCAGARRPEMRRSTQSAEGNR